MEKKENDIQVQISDEVWKWICVKHMKKCFTFWQSQGQNVHDAIKSSLADMGRLKTNPFKPNGEPVNIKVRDNVIKFYQDIYDDLDKKVKDGTYDESNIRLCSDCGLPMSEGFYLYGNYACDKECCLSQYDGDKDKMEKDLANYDETWAEAYYTEWDSIFFDD